MRLLFVATFTFLLAAVAAHGSGGFLSRLADLLRNHPDNPYQAVDPASSTEDAGNPAYPDYPGGVDTNGDHPDSSTEEEDPTPVTDSSMWVPPTPGQTREEWIDCRGMPCDEWEKTKDNLWHIFEEVNHRRLPKNQGSFDVMNKRHPNEDGTLDGCAWVTMEQSEELMLDFKEESNSERGSPRRKRRASRQKRKLSDFNLNFFKMWPTKESIKWKFDNEHTASEKQIIRSAFQSWMDETCVRFEEKGTNDLVLGPHVLVTKRLTGCHSYVGRVTLTPQQINLQGSCLYEFGIPVHEIGHTLGLWHEQQRSDRDSSIRVNYNNLDYYLGQFAKVNQLTLDVPYDTGSVMHYAPQDGSSNGGNVMETLDPLYQKSMGQKVGMSYYDALTINMAYCKDSCAGRPLPHKCARGGYQNPNNCDACKCPPGFAGDFCEEVAPSKGTPCGGVIDLTSSPQTIESPGYSVPGYYYNYQECTWLVRAPRGGRVHLKFLDTFSIYAHNQGQCYHWLEIKYIDNFAMNGPRFCGYSRPTEQLTSTTEEMVLNFRANWTAQYISSRYGFKVELKAEGGDSGAIPTTTTQPTTTTTKTTTTTTTQTPTTTTTSTTKVTENSSNNWMYSNDWLWECDFDSLEGERTWCDLQQEATDDFDWILWSGPTPSQLTGPNGAYDGQYYAYIEASNPQREGDRAILWTPVLSRAGAHCLTFYYHMYGHHVNLLGVLQGTSVSSSTPVWSKQGEQGLLWQKAVVNLELNPSDRIAFVAVRGHEYSGDIALDRIMIKPGVC